MLERWSRWCAFASILVVAGCDSDGSADGPVKVKGSVQKGPFVLGSSVQVAVLDKDGDPTGLVYNTNTMSDLGEFVVTVQKPDAAKLIGTGFYYNEFAGVLSAAPITLYALAEIKQSGTQHAYINVVTHLAQRRASKLVAGGSTLDTSVTQAESELRTALGIIHPATTPGAGTQMNLLGGDTADNEYLFGVSCILSKAAQLAGGGSLDAKLQELINTIALDLEPDGTLGSSLTSQLIAAEKALDPKVCSDNLKKWLAQKGSSATPPDLTHVIDTDKDKTPDGTDTDDDNDKTPDASDCAPLDPSKQVKLADGACVVDDTDDDDDGTADTSDCAPLDEDQEILLKDGKTCVADDTDDDNDGFPDSADCEPLDPKVVPLKEVGSLASLGEAKSVFVASNHAYVGLQAGGLAVVDVSVPASPSKVGSLSSIYATEAIASGSYAYTAYKSLIVVDVTTPASPTKVSESSYLGLAKLALNGTYAYVGTDGAGTAGTAQFHVYQLSNPQSPTVLGSISSLGRIMSVAAKGSTAYLADENKSLIRVIDAGTPAQPKEVTTLAHTSPVAVHVDGSALYAAGSNTFQVIDITQPTSPVSQGSTTVNVTGTAYGSGRMIALKGKRAYVATGGQAIQIVDVTTPASPKVLASHSTPGQTWSVFIDGSTLYVADGSSGGLRILTIGCQ